MLTASCQPHWHDVKGMQTKSALAHLTAGARMSIALFHFSLADIMPRICKISQHWNGSPHSDLDCNRGLCHIYLPPSVLRRCSAFCQFQKSIMFSYFRRFLRKPRASKGGAPLCRPEQPQGWTLGPRRPRHSGEPCGDVPCGRLVVGTT